jgi:hypothetical protein
MSKLAKNLYTNNMNRILVVLTFFVLGLVSQSPGVAADLSAVDWQKQSLKGITSIRYGVIDYSKYSITDDVATALSGLKVQVKRIQIVKEDSTSPLSTSEGMLKVFAKDREDNQCWVGLSLDQRCQLKRTPSINFDGETYSIGKLCPRAQVKSAVKSVCAEFAKDFSAQTAKE